jgi:hypothetical protein
MSMSRRNFILTSAGAASAGLAIDSTLSKPLFAAEEGHRECPVQPEPIPHAIALPFGTTVHNFFPGPVDSTLTDVGHDPSLITDFNGVIANTDVLMSGTGTDLNTGETAPYGFHADIRFMKGTFLAADRQMHRGDFAFI